MTLSTLKRLRALPAIALALLLAAALVGCSTSEPAEETPTPAPVEEPAAPQTPAAEEPEEPATEFDTQQREPISQETLVASIDSYSEGYDEPGKHTCTYDNDGRLTSIIYGDDGLGTTWTYDANGNLLTQVEQTINEDGETNTSTITYTYNEEGLPTERTFETTEPPTYIDPETGEETDDPSQGELMEWDSPKRTFEWGERGAFEKTTEYNAAGETTLYESTYQLPLVLPAFTVQADPSFGGVIGSIDDNLRMLTDKMLDANGFVMRESSYQYNSAGKLTSAIIKNGDWTVTEKRAYDDHGNLASESYDYGDGEIDERTYEWAYDDAGNPTATIARDSENGDSYDFYTYDAKGRLKTRTMASPFEGAYSISCEVYHYLIDDEELATTPEQLMADARAQVEAA